MNSWFSHDVIKIQTKKLSLLLSFYFHVILEHLKTFIQTNFRFKGILCFAIQDAWIFRLVRDAPFSWRPGKLLCGLKTIRIFGDLGTFFFFVFFRVKIKDKSSCLTSFLPSGAPKDCFCRISVRRSIHCLEFSITRGRLKISWWPCYSCTIFEAYLINSLRFSEV